MKDIDPCMIPEEPLDYFEEVISPAIKDDEQEDNVPRAKAVLDILRQFLITEDGKLTLTINGNAFAGVRKTCEEIQKFYNVISPELGRFTHLYEAISLCKNPEGESTPISADDFMRYQNCVDPLLAELCCCQKTYSETGDPMAWYTRGLESMYYLYAAPYILDMELNDFDSQEELSLEDHPRLAIAMERYSTRD